MDTYKEYPIRCKTCNEQIAAFSGLYEDLLGTGLSREEALNELGISNWCSRIAMMNPTVVNFNMENREVIEGHKNVDVITDPAPYLTDPTSRPSFPACLNPMPRAAVNLPGLTQAGTARAPGGIPLGEGIPITTPVGTGFNVPEVVGIPTINDDPSRAKQVINVGVGRQARVLNGRTYLAR